MDGKKLFLASIIFKRGLYMLTIRFEKTVCAEKLVNSFCSLPQAKKNIRIDLANIY